MSKYNNTVNIEIGMDEDGSLFFISDWSFDDEYPEEDMVFLQDILAGIYAVVSTQTESILHAGKIVQAAQGYNNFNLFETEQQDDYGSDVEIVFEPDEELAEKMKENNQEIDLNVIDFNTKKHRGH